MCLYFAGDGFDYSPDVLLLLSAFREDTEVWNTYLFQDPHVASIISNIFFIFHCFSALFQIISAAIIGEITTIPILDMQWYYFGHYLGLVMMSP